MLILGCHLHIFDEFEGFLIICLVLFEFTFDLKNGHRNDLFLFLGDLFLFLDLFNWVNFTLWWAHSFSIRNFINYNYYPDKNDTVLG